MKKIISTLLSLPMIMFIGCTVSDNTKIDKSVIKDGEIPITELKVVTDSCVTHVGELVVIRDIEHWGKFFIKQQSDALGVDFSKNSVMIITEQSKLGVYAVTQKLSYNSNTGYVLENNVVQDYTTKNCTWMRVVLAPTISPNAKISSKTTYITYDQTAKEAEIATRQIDLVGDPAAINILQNPCIIRTKEELQKHLPLQKTDIDFDNHSLIIAASNSAYQIESIESKVNFSKGGNFKMEVTLATSNVSKPTPWVRLLETPRLPMGANIELSIKYGGDNVKPVESTELDFQDSPQSYDLLREKGVKSGTLYVFRSLDELNECLPEQISANYQDIDFSKHSAMFVFGVTPTSPIKSVDQKLSYVEGFGYICHITVNNPGGAMTPDDWAK